MFSYIGVFLVVVVMGGVVVIISVDLVKWSLLKMIE